ncbi:hypothetical protein [Aquamicrobium soli]|uniref:DUF2190 family protein n=1 Tax=Aquamicrobium soli TaxID=1811518 RepID=A0ABV7KCN9_9HYPH
MAAPNIVALTSIYGRTVTVTLGATATDIVANAAASAKVLRMANLLVANPTDDPVTLNLSVVNAAPAATVKLVSNLVLPGNATLEVPASKIYLEEGDKITGMGLALVATASYEEIA